MTADVNEDVPQVDDAPSAQHLGSVLERFRPRLERMLALRLDRHLRARVDPADVLQEAFLEVTERLEEYRTRRPMPFFLWVRQVAGERLLAVHRRHMNAEKRDVRRELPLRSFPEASSQSIAWALLDSATPPSGRARRAEAALLVRSALESIPEDEREVLVLRYFERLSNQETASVLGLSASGAKKRHLRAISSMRRALEDLHEAGEQAGGLR